MEIRQLKAFVAVASEGHFGRAAAGLNLTQPGLTQRIQALERELGTQLLKRNARSVHLTAAGTMLLPHALSLLRLEDRALRDLKDYADGVTGRLRISYLSYGAVTCPARVVAELRRRNPAATLETTSGHSGVNVERLRQGIIDAAFINPAFVAPSLPEEIAVHLLLRDGVLVALPEKHPLAELDVIPVRALRREPLILFPSTPFQSFPLKLEGWLARHMGGDPIVVAHEPPEEAIDAVVGTSAAITFTKASRAAAAPVPGIAYRRMSPDLLIDFGIAYLRDDQSPMLAKLLRVADQMAEGAPGELPEGSELVTSDEVQLTPLR